MLSKHNPTPQLLTTPAGPSLDRPAAISDHLLTSQALQSDFVDDLRQSLLLRNGQEPTPRSMEIRQHDLELARNQTNSNPASNGETDKFGSKESPQTASETQEITAVPSVTPLCLLEGEQGTRGEGKEITCRDKGERQIGKAPLLVDDRHGQTPFNKKTQACESGTFKTPEHLQNSSSVAATTCSFKWTTPALKQESGGASALRSLSTANLSSNQVHKSVCSRVENQGVNAFDQLCQQTTALRSEAVAEQKSDQNESGSSLPEQPRAEPASKFPSVDPFSIKIDQNLSLNDLVTDLITPLKTHASLRADSKFASPESQIVSKQATCATGSDAIWDLFMNQDNEQAISSQSPKLKVIEASQQLLKRQKVTHDTESSFKPSRSRCRQEIAKECEKEKQLIQTAVKMLKSPHFQHLMQTQNKKPIWSPEEVKMVDSKPAKSKNWSCQTESRLQSQQNGPAHQNESEVHTANCLDNSSAVGHLQKDLDPLLQLQIGQMPAYDRSVDYLALTRSMNASLKRLQQSVQAESEHYLETLEHFVASEKKLSKQIEVNESKCLTKRNEKLSRKQLRHFMQIHPSGPMNLQHIEATDKTQREIPMAAEADFNQRLIFAETSPLHGKFPTSIEQSPQTARGVIRPKVMSETIAEMAPTRVAELTSKTQGVNLQQLFQSNGSQLAQSFAENPETKPDPVSHQNSIESNKSEGAENNSVSEGKLGKTSDSGGKHRKPRRTANQISKDFKCLYCDKRYGSEAAAIMHMRQKHDEGTKQQIEKERGIKVHEELRRAQTFSKSQASDTQEHPRSEPISNPKELQAKLKLSSGAAQPFPDQLMDMKDLLKVEQGYLQLFQSRQLQQ